MKILFVENRYKTALWEAIAQDLVSQGHQIYWIVQNPFFKPSFGEVHVVPFPKRGNETPENAIVSKELAKIKNSNRALNYFELKDNGFIEYYHQLIEQIIDGIGPDVAFGESTAFHELLVSNSCHARSIHFLHPSSCRYPAGRFSFYLHDTLIPFGGSNEVFKEDVLEEIVRSITERKAKPDYMVKQQSPVSKVELIADKLRLVRSFYKGERYNTPSPFVKRKLTKKSREFVREWDEIATPIDALPTAFGILFPLQMQPEANIDVWGAPNSNQLKVIQGIVDAMGDEAIVIIKPNPKSKYEIDRKLLDFIESNPTKVYCLEHSSKMEDALKRTNLVITVTGTISLECVLSNTPVAMYGFGIQTKQKNCIQLSESKDIRRVMQQVVDGTFPKNSAADNRAFISELVSTSFKGIIGDGMHGRANLESEENMKAIKLAFHQILKKVEEHRS